MANFSLHGINLDDMISSPSLSYEALLSMLRLVKAIREETFLEAFNDVPGFLLDREG